MSYSAICGLDMKTIQSMWQFCKLYVGLGDFSCEKKAFPGGKKAILHMNC